LSLTRQSSHGRSALPVHRGEASLESGDLTESAPGSLSFWGNPAPRADSYSRGVSEDKGETWRLAAVLPEPITAVRFALG
jgi:hypothetical protein